jgi:hypothetical protein
MTIQNTALTTTAQQIVVNAAGTTAITTIHLCNYSPVTQIANIYAVPNGSSASASTILYSNVSITAYNTLIISTEKMILSTVGDAIMANCSNATTVTATVSSIGI